MDYRYAAQPVAEGFTPIVAAPQSGLHLLGMGRLRLSVEGAVYKTHTREDEMALDVLSGACTLALEGEWGSVRYERVGQRSTPFAGPPSVVYVPRGTHVTITCLVSPLSAVVVRAPSRRETVPVLIDAEDVPVESFGRDNWQRDVYPSIGVNVDADRIMMGETHSPSGNWASYPPHKHDQNRPPERISEEIYHFLIDPPHGFGMQGLWTAPGASDPIEGACLLRNGDTVAIPRGYHPTVVAPGFRMVTVWAYAGEERVWGSWAGDPTYVELL